MYHSHRAFDQEVANRADLGFISTTRLTRLKNLKIQTSFLTPISVVPISRGWSMRHERERIFNLPWFTHVSEARPLRTSRGNVAVSWTGAAEKATDARSLISLGDRRRATSLSPRSCLQDRTAWIRTSTSQPDHRYLRAAFLEYYSWEILAGSVNSPSALP